MTLRNKGRGSALRCSQSVLSYGRDGAPRRLRACGMRAPTFVFLAFFVAKMMALADVVIDRSSEIVIPTNAPYATRLAAEDLNFFLKGVLGAPLMVVERRTEGKTAIVLGGDGHAGRVPLPGDACGGRGATALPVGSRVPRDRDGYVIDASGDVVRIVGNDDDVADVSATAALPDEAPWQPCFRRGTLFGVYAFLERFAGIRMYFPGPLGTCIPKAERITIHEGRVEESPAFSVRRFGYADGPVASNLLDGMDETSFKRLNWYRLRMETAHLKCCHGAKTHCLSPETWDAIYTNACAMLAVVSSKPPYRAQRSRGTRDPTNSTFGRGTRDACPPCQLPTTNYQLPTTNYQLPTTNYQLIDAMPKDGFTWLRHCKCEWCESNIPFSDTSTGYASDLVWRRTAELANRLKAKFPNARVSQMSYIPYASLPTNDIPDNVDVFVARRGPWAEGTAIGEREKDEVRAWHEKLGRKVSLWNYPDKVDCWNLEMKDIPQLAPRAWASYYRAVAPHVTGAFAESESDRWIYNYLNYYVFSRICWNPDADVEAILAEHHRLMFGAAAKEMAEFFDILEQCWMKVVAKPYETPLGPGVCEAPTKDELCTKIYSPEVLGHLAALLDAADAKADGGSLEALRIALFKREYLEPLRRRFGGRWATALPVGSCVPRDRNATGSTVGTASRAVRIGLIADIHIGDDNDATDLKRALRLFDARKADVVLAAGDLTDFGLLSQLKQVAAAWNEVFPDSHRSDGEPVARLFHYGDHDTALNFRARQAEVVAKGRWPDYIPHIGPVVAWERAFGEPFEPVVRRIVKGCEFTLVHFLPDDMVGTAPRAVRGHAGRVPLPAGACGGRGATALPVGSRVPRDRSDAWLHVFSQHRAYRGLFARPGCGDEVSWDDGASLAVVTNVPNMIAVCGHAHISATNDTSFVAMVGTAPRAVRGHAGRVPLPNNFAAITIPSLFYQIETWLPKPRGNHDSHQALFLTAAPDGIIVERLDVRTGKKLGPDIQLAGHVIPNVPRRLDGKPSCQ